MEPLVWLGIREPDVALTDYLLFVECLVIFGVLWNKRQKEPVGAFAWLFLCTGMASLFGGTVHGFFPHGTLGQKILWPATLISIGGSCWALMSLCGSIGFSSRTHRWFNRIGFLQFVGMVVFVLFFTQAFWLAIINYLPCVFLLLVILCIRFFSQRERGLLWGISAFLLSVVAAGIQYLGIGVHPLYFNHNALYHLFQFVAFLFLMKAALFFAAQSKSG